MSDEINAQKNRETIARLQSNLKIGDKHPFLQHHRKSSLCTPLFEIEHEPIHLL